VCEGKGSGLERGERGTEEMEWGSYYLGNVFEEWPGEVRRPWNGTPLLLLSTLTTCESQVAQLLTSRATNLPDRNHLYSSAICRSVAEL